MRGGMAPIVRYRNTFEDREHAEEDRFIRIMEEKAKDAAKGKPQKKEKEGDQAPVKDADKKKKPAK